MAEKKGRKVRVRARRWITVAGTVVVLGGGAGAWAATRPSDAAYRLTAAGPASVSSVLSATGTIQSVNQATLSFPVSGQVSAVNVQVGQQVTPGQVLATLDTTNLATQVSSAQSRAAAAQAKLATDETGQTAAAGGGPATPGAGTGGSARTAAPGGGKPAGPPADVRSGQDAVKNAQHQVDADLTADNTAIDQEKAACAQTPAQTSSHPPSTSSSAPPTSTTTSSDPPSSSSSGGSGASGPTSDCTALIQRVLTDQGRTASDEQALANAENGLTTALDQAAAAPPGGAAVPSAPSGGPAPGTAAKPSGSAAGGRAQAPASAAQLAADQASVDATNADLAAANQSLSAATLTSPIAGTVAQVGVSAGQSVAGASTQNDIVVIGPGSDEVTTTVSDTQVGQVHIGQTATVTPDGTSLRLAGQVTQVGMLGSTSSSGGGATYPVTISLDATSQQLFAGATAAVSINAGAANAAVAVPTSAVHTAGAQRFVAVLRNGQVTMTPVTVGVVGTTLTEIQSGLRAGDQVVIADMKAPLPTTNGLRGLGGGGGGGFGGGGGGARPGGGGPGGGGPGGGG